jgi:hypothetical protein
MTLFRPQNHDVRAFCSESGASIHVPPSHQPFPRFPCLSSVRRPARVPAPRTPVPRNRDRARCGHVSVTLCHAQICFQVGLNAPQLVIESQDSTQPTDRPGMKKLLYNGLMVAPICERDSAGVPQHVRIDRGAVRRAAAIRLIELMGKGPEAVPDGTPARPFSQRRAGGRAAPASVLGACPIIEIMSQCAHVMTDLARIRESLQPGS